MTKPQVDVRALASLARLDVSDEERLKLEKQIPDILAFVETIQKVSADAPQSEPTLRNVMREDASAHESGVYTEELLSAAPSRSGDHISVMRVITKGK